MKHEMPLVPGGARTRGQHQVDDVVGQVVLAVGDEDLLAGDAPGAVLGVLDRLVASAPTSDPAWGSVRFIVPVHSPSPSSGGTPALLLDP